ncbi:MAG: penicillin acylase family protein [Rhodospirillaceae bacterium]|nr:penicillin acylase family protein [Rhodospirillaceae bacterium]
MKRPLRALLFALLGLCGLGLGLAAALGGYGLASAYLALPLTEGSLALAGVSAPTTVTRDERGVPWIEATNAADAYFALGYVHAQDRLFQMELMRRAGQGRLAEILGPLGVGSDKFMRTLGLYRLSQDNLGTLDSETKIALDAYAMGVNAFMAREPLPLEFKLLAHTPEPWVPADSVVWQKLMGMQLSGNWAEELSRAAMIAKLGEEKAQQLWPNVGARSPITLASLPVSFITELRTVMLNVVQPTLASNVWVLGPTRTATGAPILANDPHLSFQSPNLWYLAGLSYPGVTLTGATTPGVPFHVLGHNGQIAWGFTTTHGDTQDLFVETLSDDGARYLTPDGPMAFESREEVINVRFGEPQKIMVRTTRHGPVVSDILPAASNLTTGGKHVVALAATLLIKDDRSIETIYRLALAAAATEFVESVRTFNAPEHNMMVADKDGSIAFVTSGRIPLRKNKNCDGLLPSDGASGECDWVGMVAFEAWPKSLNPESGLLFNANNKVVSDDYPVMIAKDWPEGYRAQRIEDFFAARSGLTIKDMNTLQTDHVSLMAREVLPLLLDRLQPRDTQDSRLKEHMTAWDGTMSRQKIGPLIFALWIERLKARILADELGDSFRSIGGARPTLLKSILTENTSWCDDINTPDAETCDMQINGAWAEAVTWLTNYSSDDNDWRWEKWHVARFDHPIFSSIPGLSWLGSFAVATDGDDFTVNRGSFTASTSRVPFRHFHGHGYRAIYDLADLSRSQFSMAGGQSGHQLSTHFDDLLEGWANGETFDLVAPKEGHVSRLFLTPSP